METFGGNGVNPGYRIKKISAEVSQGQSHQRNKQKKNLEILYNKENKAFVKKSPTSGLRKLIFFVHRRKTLRNQINIGNKGNHDVDKKSNPNKKHIKMK